MLVKCFSTLGGGGLGVFTLVDDCVLFWDGFDNVGNLLMRFREVARSSKAF